MILERKSAIICVLIFVIGAGCLSGQPTAGPSSETRVHATTTEQDPPSVDKPDELTNESVIEYASKYEHAILHEQIYEPGADVSLTCNARLTRSTQLGYYVAAACGGSVTYEDGSHGDLAPNDHLYFINETETIRIDAKYLRDYTQADIYKSTETSENLQRTTGLNSEGFELLNFQSTNHTITVNIAYLNQTSRPKIFSRTYEVGRHAGVIQPGVTARKGSYTVQVKLNSGESTRYRWKLTEVQHEQFSIIISPDGELEILYVERPRMVQG